MKSITIVALLAVLATACHDLDATGTPDTDAGGDASMVERDDGTENPDMGDPEPSCDDGSQNGDETDVDCGGSCSPCADGSGCSAGDDCSSGYCDGGVCAATSCDDGAQNGNESDVDCGGACPACDDGLACGAGDDCASGVCTDDECQAPTCGDGIANGDESDIDCGGACGACDVGDACIENDDCPFQICEEGTCAYPRSCRDLRLRGLGDTDGAYTIDADGPVGPAPAVEVQCDMTIDGGAGYTMLLIEDDPDLAGANTQQPYRDACAEYGMEIIVPRSRAHAEVISKQLAGGRLNIVGVYPKQDGASGLDDFTGRCRGEDCRFFLSDWSDNSSTCVENQFEPNGDNTTDSALYANGDPVAGCPLGQFNDRNDTISQRGWVLCSTNDAGPPIQTSCLTVLQNNTLQNTALYGPNGIYTIQPPGSPTPVDVYCDFIRDGGGYTYLKVEQGRAYTTPEAQAYCAEFGMQLFIPRTPDHRLNAFFVGLEGDIGPSGRANYLRIMGVYPDSDGAACSYTPFTSSNGACNWSASDGGPFWIHSSTVFIDPDGSTGGVTDSLIYHFANNGQLTGVNDVADGTAASSRFICDVGDKWGP